MKITKVEPYKGSEYMDDVFYLARLCIREGVPKDVRDEAADLAETISRRLRDPMVHWQLKGHGRALVIASLIAVFCLGGIVGAGLGAA